LRTTQKNALDDGTVVGHENLDEAAASTQDAQAAPGVKVLAAAGSTSSAE
jgi:hypothetical protein